MAVASRLSDRREIREVPRLCVLRYFPGQGRLGTGFYKKPLTLEGLSHARHTEASGLQAAEVDTIGRLGGRMAGRFIQPANERLYSKQLLGIRDSLQAPVNDQPSTFAFNEEIKRWAKLSLEFPLACKRPFARKPA
jgi:hypothetical protein